MQQRMLICLINIVAVVTAAGVFGDVDIEPNSAEARAGIRFPKIPGLNSPIFGLSLFPSSDGLGSLFGGPRGPFGGPGGPFGGPGGRLRPPLPPPPPGITPPDGLPQLPNITSLIPELPSGENATSIFVPRIRGPPPLSSLPRIPGLSNAIQDARNHVQTALGGANNFVDGIQTAIGQAFRGNETTTAIRTLVNTILDAYLIVAENCPVIVIGSRVLREGIRLSNEVAISARNVVFGSS